MFLLKIRLFYNSTENWLVFGLIAWRGFNDNDLLLFWDVLFEPFISGIMNNLVISLRIRPALENAAIIKGLIMTLFFERSKTKRMFKTLRIASRISTGDNKKNTEYNLNDPVYAK